MTPRCCPMKSPALAVGTVMLLALMPMSGCLQGDKPTPELEEDNIPEGVFVTGPDGLPVDEDPLPLIFNFSDVGEDGAEPSIGVTSSGCIFFIA